MRVALVLLFAAGIANAAILDSRQTWDDADTVTLTSSETPPSKSPPEVENSPVILSIAPAPSTEEPQDSKSDEAVNSSEVSPVSESSTSEASSSQEGTDEDNATPADTSVEADSNQTYAVIELRRVPLTYEIVPLAPMSDQEQSASTPEGERDSYLPEERKGDDGDEKLTTKDVDITKDSDEPLRYMVPPAADAPNPWNQYPMSISDSDGQYSTPAEVREPHLFMTPPQQEESAWSQYKLKRDSGEEEESIDTTPQVPEEPEAEMVTTGQPETIDFNPSAVMPQPYQPQQPDSYLPQQPMGPPPPPQYYPTQSPPPPMMLPPQPRQPEQIPTEAYWHRRFFAQNDVIPPPRQYYHPYEYFSDYYRRPERMSFMTPSASTYYGNTQQPGNSLDFGQQYPPNYPNYYSPPPPSPPSYDEYSYPPQAPEYMLPRQRMFPSPLYSNPMQQNPWRYASMYPYQQQQRQQRSAYDFRMMYPPQQFEREPIYY